jgi:hypothetical protein
MGLGRFLMEIIKVKKKSNILSIFFMRWNGLKPRQGKVYCFGCEGHHRERVIFSAAKFSRIENTRSINTD